MTLLLHGLFFALLLLSVGVGDASRKTGSGRRLRAEVGARAIPGRPGEDYPILSTAPRTGFSCLGRLEGFYADPETRCQLFHMCSLQSGHMVQQSVLCPNGTVFNQRVNTCDWWNRVQCGTTSSSQDFLRQTSENDGFKNIEYLTSETDLRTDKQFGYERSSVNIKAETLNTLESRNYLNSKNNLRLTADKSTSGYNKIGDTKTNPSKNVQFSSSTDNLLTQNSNSPVTEVSIKPRVHYTHSLKYTSDNPLYSLNPIVQLARDASLLSSFTTSEDETVKKKPFQRFVLDGVLPQYGTQSLDGPPQDEERFKDDRTSVDDSNSQLPGENGFDLGNFDLSNDKTDATTTPKSVANENESTIGSVGNFPDGVSDKRVESNDETQKKAQDNSENTNQNDGSEFFNDPPKSNVDESFPSTVRVSTGYSFTSPKNPFDEGPTQFKVTTSYSVQDLFPTASPSSGSGANENGNKPFSPPLTNTPAGIAGNAFESNNDTLNISNIQTDVSGFEVNPTAEKGTESSTIVDNLEDPLLTTPQKPTDGQTISDNKDPTYSGKDNTRNSSPNIDERFIGVNYNTNNLKNNYNPTGSPPVVTNASPPGQKNQGESFFTSSYPVYIPGHFVTVVTPVIPHQFVINADRSGVKQNDDNVRPDPYAVLRNMQAGLGGTQFGQNPSSVTPSPSGGPKASSSNGYDQSFTAGTYPTQTPTTQSYQPSNPTLNYNQDIYGNVYLGPNPAFENSHIMLPMIPPPFGYFSSDPKLGSNKYRPVSNSPQTKTQQTPSGNKYKNENNNFPPNNQDLETIIGQSLGLDDIKNKEPQFNPTGFPGSTLPTTSSSNGDDSVFGQQFPNSGNAVSISPSIEAYAGSTTTNPPVPSAPSFGHSAENNTSSQKTLQSSTPATFDVSLGGQTPNFPSSTTKYPGPTSTVSNTGFNSFHPTPFGYTTPMPMFFNPPQYLPPQYYHTILPDYSRIFPPLFQPADLVNINSLKGSSWSSGFGRPSANIIKSIGFSFDTPQGRELFEKARSEGLFDT